MLYISDTASLCSVAPSLHELDSELAQYGDLLDVPKETADENTTLPDYCEGIVADINPYNMDSVRRLNELLRPESEELDQFALRPTAASLGLKDAIKECVDTDLCESGCCYSYCYCCCYFLWPTNWPGAVMVRVTDLSSRGRGFDSHYQVMTLGKLFTHMCLCHQTV